MISMCLNLEPVDSRNEFLYLLMTPTDKVNTLPHLNDKCSQHFRYSDLIICGETVNRTNIDNRPLQLESWSAISAIAENILDPITENFSKPKITYGFASTNLLKLKPKPTTPTLDQHCAYELNSRGNLINKRGGAAVDFKVTGLDALNCARWIKANLEFDRLYYYGPDASLHVSFAPQPSGLMYHLIRSSKTNRLYPQALKP